MSRVPMKFGLVAALVLAATAHGSSPSPALADGAGCLPGSLRSTLDRIRSKFGPVRVISGYRGGATIAGSGRMSYHASCRAVDFYAPSGRQSEVVAWLRSNHSGGLGIYSCGMNHIHIDNGPSVQWNRCVGGNDRTASNR